jgi:hypothetical protein
VTVRDRQNPYDGIADDVSEVVREHAQVHPAATSVAEPGASGFPAIQVMCRSMSGPLAQSGQFAFVVRHSIEEFGVRLGQKLDDHRLPRRSAISFWI